jgi:hypothetical protein
VCKQESIFSFGNYSKTSCESRKSNLSSQEDRHLAGYFTDTENRLLYFYNFKKSPSANAKGLVIVWLPQQNDFRTSCISGETEKVYQKLEEVIRIC